MPPRLRLTPPTGPPARPPKAYTNLADGNHTFEVRATDPAGNTDPTPASRSFTIDSGAPDTQIDSGPTGTTSNSSPSFGFSADEPGSSFECRLDSASAADWAACSLAKAYTNLADGNHTFEVRATDPAGNTDPTPASPQLHDRHRRPRHPDRLRAHRDDLQLEPQLRLLGR